MRSRQSIYQLKNLIRRDVGSQELAAVLDLFPNATLLIDSSSGFIRLGNSKATELSGYTKNELHGLDLRMILPDFRSAEDEILEAENEGVRSFTTTIITRMGSQIPVEIRIEPIHQGGGWHLLVIEAVASQRKRQAEIAIQSLRWDALRSLVQSTRALSLQPSFEMALEAGHNLTGAGILALYRLLGHKPNFVRYAAFGETDVLPQSLEGVERVHLRKPTLWTPGKHTATSLNRSASAEGFKYLVTYPLIENNILQGLLVLGDKESNPPDQLMQVSQLIADAVTASIETKFLINNLNDRISLDETEIEIGRSLKDVVNIGLIITGVNLVILDINSKAAARLGYNQEEVINLPLGNILIGPESLGTAIRAAREGLSTSNLGSVRLRDRNGKEFPANVSINPVFQENKLKAILVIIQDQTDWEGLRRMNERLEPRAYIGDRLSEYSHDARNQIAGIKAGTEVLLRRFADDEKNYKVVQRILNESNKLEKRLSSVLESSASGEYKMGLVDITSLIGNILENMGYRLTRAGIQTELLSDPATPPVFGDQSKLELVFENLITNATQAMYESGGKLTVKVHPSGSPVKGQEKVEIIVSDTGPGIPEEVIPLIFGQYYTTSSKRTGLGLSIVKRIITSHNGSITAESMDGGTIFKLLLPGAIENLSNNHGGIE